MVQKHSVREVIIPRLGTAPLAAGTPLFDNVLDTPNLPIGGFGVFTQGAATGSYIPKTTVATPVIGNTPYIQFIQRRDVARDSGTLPIREYIKSGEIYPGCIQPITMTGSTARSRRNQLWLVGAPAGTVGEVPVLDETEYSITGVNTGRRTELYNSQMQPATRLGNFVTPDYFNANIISTTPQKRDDILQNLAFNYNLQSAAAYAGESIALCIDDAATTTPNAVNQVKTINDVATANVGDRIVVGFTDLGQAIPLILDADIINSFAESIANGTFAGNEQIIPFARPTSANLAVTGRLVAGGRAANTPDAQVTELLLIPMDYAKATYDEFVGQKERLFVGLTGGFGNGVSNRQVVGVDNGNGYAQNLQDHFLSYQANKMHSSGTKPWASVHTAYSSEVVDGAIYDMYYINYCYNRSSNILGPTVSPRVTLIALQNTEIAGFTGFVGAANPHKAYLEGLINSWIPSVNPAQAALSL